MSLRSFVKKIPFLKKLFKKGYIQKKSEDFKKIAEKAATDPKLVVFESYQGRSYTCSPRAIYEYMLKCPDFAGYHYVWVFRDTGAHGKFPENTRLVKFDSPESFDAYSRAGTLIVNSRLREFIVPRDDQKYIQCWHGTPFKKIGCDVTAGANATSTVEEIYSEYTKEAEKIYRFISPCDYTTEKLMSAFGLTDKSRVIQKGYPRNDPLFNCDENRLLRIKKALDIPEGKKVLLYCPTFRDNSFNSEGYSLKPGVNFDSLQKLYGEDMIILFRAHYFIAHSFDFEKYGGFVRDVSGYDEITDLYLVSDMLMTDYSSVFFDYANLCRPMIFYHYDVESYKNDMRDFYFGTAMLPGFTVTKQDRLEKVISDIISDLKKGGDGLLRYRTAVAAFNKRFNPVENGHSSERTVKEIFGI